MKDLRGVTPRPRGLPGAPEHGAPNIFGDVTLGLAVGTRNGSGHSRVLDTYLHASADKPGVVITEESDSPLPTLRQMLRARPPHTLIAHPATAEVLTEEDRSGAQVVVTVKAQEVVGRLCALTPWCAAGVLLDGHHSHTAVALYLGQERTWQVMAGGLLVWRPAFGTSPEWFTHPAHLGL